MTIVNDKDGDLLYFECKYCGDDNGSFNTRTGNHTECERIAKLETALKKIIYHSGRMQIGNLVRISDIARRALGEKWTAQNDPRE